MGLSSKLPHCPRRLIISELWPGQMLPPLSDVDTLISRPDCRARCDTAPSSIDIETLHLELKGPGGFGAGMYILVIGLGRFRVKPTGRRFDAVFDTDVCRFISPNSVLFSCGNMAQNAMLAPTNAPYLCHLVAFS